MKPITLLLALVALPMFGGCDKISSVEEPAPIDTAIVLTPSNERILANGVATVELTAEIGDHIAPNQKITFETDWGAFAGAAAGEGENGATIVVTANGRRATARLIGDTSNRPVVTVTARIGDDGPRDDADIRIDPARPDKIWIELEKGTIDADLAESTTVILRLQRDTGRVTNELPAEFSVEPKSLAIITSVADSDRELVTATVRSATKQTGTVTILATMLLASGKQDTVRTTLELAEP